MENVEYSEFLTRLKAVGITGPMIGSTFWGIPPVEWGDSLPYMVEGEVVTIHDEMVGDLSGRLTPGVRFQFWPTPEGEAARAAIGRELETPGMRPLTRVKKLLNRGDFLASIIIEEARKRWPLLMEAHYSALLR